MNNLYFRSIVSILILTIVNKLIVSGHIKRSDIIYILMWTSSVTEPFSWMDMERDTFINRGCEYQNCFVTNDAEYFEDIRDFDVLLFNVVNLQTSSELPTVRDPRQTYVLVSIHPSSTYPIPDSFNGYFNRTWTYKLDSDIYFGYVVVKDNSDQIIGPRVNMNWKDVREMKPISRYIKHKLRKKNKAAAWFVSNCKTNSQREIFAKRLNAELSTYGHHIDIYGTCGDKKCSLDNMDDCFARIETNYYFYLAFENSFAEDYVTEHILFALEHFAVPVVYGGANYTRFMPDGIYLDSRKLEVGELARQMDALIKNKEWYYDFFKWREYYSFHSTEEGPETDDFCSFCAAMNDIIDNAKSSVYLNIDHWWNGKTKYIDPEVTSTEYHLNVKNEVVIKNDRFSKRLRSRGKNTRKKHTRRGKMNNFDHKSRNEELRESHKAEKIMNESLRNFNKVFSNGIDKEITSERITNTTKTTYKNNAKQFITTTPSTITTTTPSPITSTTPSTIPTKQYTSTTQVTRVTTPQSTTLLTSTASISTTQETTTSTKSSAVTNTPVPVSKASVKMHISQFLTDLEEARERSKNQREEYEEYDYNSS